MFYHHLKKDNRMLSQMIRVFKKQRLVLKSNLRNRFYGVNKYIKMLKWYVYIQ